TQSASAVHPREERARDRPAEHAGERRRRHEGRDGASALPRGEPVGEIEDHAGEETRLGKTEQQADAVELEPRMREHRAGGDNAPGDHDSGHPAAGSHALHDEVAWYLEEEIA